VGHRSAHLRRDPGANQGIRIPRRIDGEVAEFVRLSYWQSWQPRQMIEAFAGSAPQIVVDYPDDNDLLERELAVAHNEAVCDHAAGDENERSTA